jgi:hypothetical protein
MGQRGYRTRPFSVRKIENIARNDEDDRGAFAPLCELIYPEIL